jgi:excisionase family DNA binding protein
MFPHLSEALPQLATPAEIAPYLHMHPKTVERKLRAGTLPGTKIDGRWLVNVEKLAERLGGRVAS